MDNKRTWNWYNGVPRWDDEVQGRKPDPPLDPNIMLRQVAEIAHLPNVLILVLKH